MYILPLQPNPNFKYRSVLDGYEFELRFAWAPVQSMWFVDVVCEELYVDVKGIALVTGFNILGGRGLYQVGFLALIDLQGSEDPNFEDFGDRWKLLYLTRDEVDARGT